MDFLRTLLILFLLATPAWGHDWPLVPEWQLLNVPDTPRKVQDAQAKLLVIQSPKFDYPYALRKAGVEGNVIAVMTVENGKVVRAAILQSSGNNLLDSYVISLAQQFSFTKSTMNSFSLSVSFKLNIN